MLPIALGPFVLHAPIGRGATGVVWRGEFVERGIPVAVKVLTARKSRSKQFRAAFQSEVEAVASLSHPGIVLLFDYGTVAAEVAEKAQGQLPAGQPYLAMELASQGSIARHHGALNWPSTLSALHALLDALAHAHARGVVHRDLKPSNILVSGPLDLRPGLKLSDFGIASVAGRDDTHRISGTPPYMAPEQFRGDPRLFGPWTDLYALGCVAWEWVTGHPPFGEGRAMRLAHRHLYDEAPSLHPRFEVPKGLEAWLRRLLEKSPDHRYRLAAEAAWSLDQLGNAIPSLTPTPRPRVQAVPRDTLDALLLEPTGDLDRTMDELVLTPAELREPADATLPPIPIQRPDLPPHWDTGESHRTDARVLQATMRLYGLRAVPLVGRHAERDRLWASLQEVDHLRSPRVVVLQGQAGVGKSALANWLCERVHELGTSTPLRAHHSRIPGSGQGLAPMLARHLRITGLTPDAALERIQRFLRLGGRRDPSEAKALASLLTPSTDAEDNLHPLIATAQERYALITQILTVLAQRRPLVVWLDDVQWSAASLEFVSSVLNSPLDLPVLFVLTVQNEALPEAPTAREELEALRPRHEVRSISLPPLPEHDARELVQRLLRLDADLAETIVRRTGGNPLFTVHLLGDWVQRGVLQPSPRGLVLLSNAQAPLPDDLYEVWSTRVARVLSTQHHDGRLALELAATLGDAVVHEEWRSICALASIKAPADLTGLLVRSRLALPTADGWRFAHGMLRETVERLAREAGRWEAHNALAARMMAAMRGTPKRVARMGRYLLEAGEPSAAADALLESARRRMQKDEARLSADLLERARRALDSGHIDEDDGRRSVWRLLRARVLKARQDLDESWEVVRQVEASAQLHGWGRLEAESLAEQADITRIRGDFPASLRLFRRALTRYRELDDPHGVADTLRSLSSVSIQLGNPSLAEELLLDARETYTRLGDRFGAAMCLAGLGDIARVRRRWDEATGWFRSSLTLLRALGHRSGVALGLHGLAEVQRLTGDLTAARAGYLQVIELDAALGRDNSISRLNLALCQIARQEYDEAVASLHELQQLWSHRGRPGYLAIVHIALLPCMASVEDWQGYRHHLAAGSRLLVECSLVDLDVARLSEQAGSMAAEADQLHEANGAWQLALQQWSTLDAEAKVEELRLALEHLPEGTSPVQVRI